MRKLFTLCFSVLLFAGAFGQRPEGVFKLASVSPVIDGVVDDVWAESEVYSINLNFADELPTLGDEGTTTWKGLWDETGIYILVEVNDDDWYTNYTLGGVGGDHWTFDKPEVYFDVNSELEDGGGGGGGNGHYQVAPAPTEGSTDGTLLEDGDAQYAFMVDGSTYLVEYFIPMTMLLDKDGFEVDKLGKIGFDVTVIDRDMGDESRKRAVWANIGGLEESYSNMDDCGWVTFDGAEEPTYVESVVISDAVIDENNGTVMIQAVVLPEEATNKNLVWSVEYVDGRANVSSDGMVTGVVDGTVTITAAAADGSWMEDNCTVTISGQIVSQHEINLIRNGYFDMVNDAGVPLEWNVNDGGVVNDEGVFVVDPTEGADIWSSRLQQTNGWGLNTTDSYTLSFVSWADAADTLNLDFEDARSEVDYNRYGTSGHALAVGGESEWEFQSALEPTKYVFDVVFDELVEGANEQFQFMLGHHDPVLYIDSVELINDADWALITDYDPTETVTISGGETVEVDGTLQLSAETLPATATLPGVRWSVVDGTGSATIDATGLLTGVTEGVVTVMASAKDDSKVTTVLDVTVGSVGISQKSVNTLKVYPNPAVNELTVELSSEGTVSIYNSVGQKMDEVFVSASQYTFDISSYATGIYFVKTDNSIAKFIK